MTPLRVAYLLTGEGEASLYCPGARGNFSQDENNTPALPLSVAVSTAAFLVGVDNEIGVETMLQDGTRDQPLPRSIEARITTRGKALVFLRRLGNYLDHRDGVARIHHTTLLMLAGVDSKDRKAPSRYKTAGKRAHLFQESDGYIVGDATPIAIRVARSNAPAHRALAFLRAARPMSKTTIMAMSVRLRFDRDTPDEHPPTFCGHPD
jgi:hypothetical protein